MRVAIDTNQYVDLRKGVGEPVGRREKSQDQDAR